MTLLSRRALLASACVGTPMLLAGRSARAAAYPARDIQVIVPNAPGGSSDTYVRFIAPVLERYLPGNANIVPINVAGGGGAKGVVELYRARPDGYTLAIFNIPGAFILQQQQHSRAYDLAKISWIGLIAEGEHYVIAAGKNSPLKTFDDLKALSRKRPVKFSVTGPEGTGYAATKIGTRLLGIRTQLISGYKGAVDYVVAAIRGDVDAVVVGRPTAMRFVRGGTLRVLASFERKSSIPGVPDATTLGQPDLAQITIERPLGGPPGLPAAVQTTLSTALAKAEADPMVKQWAMKNDLTMMAKTPAEVTAMVARQKEFFDRWKDYLVAG